MSQNKKNFQKYYDYMQSVTPRLLEAERVVDEIKGSPEWKKAFGYFQTLYTRGQLTERPTKKNGYKIETGKNTVRISDIEDILTPEQLELVKQKVF